MKRVVCNECSHSYLISPSRVDGRKHFCSKECRYKSQVGRKLSGKALEVARETLKKYRGTNPPKGEKHYAWKGVQAGYRAIHTWLQRTFGTPNTCEQCGKKGTGHSIQWANVSKKYQRDRSDWKRLCASCHKRYDLERKTICVF